MPDTKEVRGKTFHDLRQAALAAGAPAVVDAMILAASANFPHIDSAGDGKDDRELEVSFYCDELVEVNDKGEKVRTGQHASVGVTVSVVRPAAPGKKR
jgi:hypothetical protein